MPNVIRSVTRLETAQFINCAVTPALLIAPQPGGSLYLPLQCILIPQVTTDFGGTAAARLMWAGRQLSDIPDIAPIINANQILNLMGYAPAIPWSGLPLDELMNNSFRLALSGTLTGGGGRVLVVMLYQLIYPHLPVN